MGEVLFFPSKGNCGRCDTNGLIFEACGNFAGIMPGRAKRPAAVFRHVRKLMTDHFLQRGLLIGILRFNDIQVDSIGPRRPVHAVVQTFDPDLRYESQFLRIGRIGTSHLPPHLRGNFLRTADKQVFGLHIIPALVYF